MIGFAALWFQILIVAVISGGLAVCVTDTLNQISEMNEWLASQETEVE